MGGGAGSLARYGVGKLMSNLMPLGFPYGTLMANIISSFILGMFIGMTSGRFDNFNGWKFFVAIGFCGGFSTFSTFSAETFELFKNGLYQYAFISIVANLLICFLMIGVGIWLGRGIQ